MSDGEVRRKKKKKRSRSRSKSRSDIEEDIDDEDRELLKENLGIDIVKKRKRIRMESGSESGSESGGERDSIPEVGEGGQAESENEYEMDDWIVDADGKPIRSERKKKKAHIFSDEPRQQAEDIFGVKFDYGEFEQYGDDQEEMEEDYEEDEEEIDGKNSNFLRKIENRKIREIVSFVYFLA